MNFLVARLSQQNFHPQKLMIISVSSICFLIDNLSKK